MLEHNASESLWPPDLVELMEFLEAHCQVCLAGSDNLLPLLFRQEIKHSHSKEKGSVIGGVSLVKRGDLFEQILLARCRHSVLFALLTTIAGDRLLFNPARLDK